MSVFVEADVTCDYCDERGENIGLYCGFDIMNQIKLNNPKWKITKKETTCPKCRMINNAEAVK